MYTNKEIIQWGKLLVFLSGALNHKDKYHIKNILYWHYLFEKTFSDEQYSYLIDCLYHGKSNIELDIED
uniref:Uncharacterized protein n=1 Tax=Dulem virus 36 TaxID=3145754 RepID=A0AAU8B098_9CAUD